MTAAASPEKNVEILTSTRSVDTASTMKSSSSSTPHLMSASVHENLIQVHHKVDPLEFYIIEAVLGEGSMGYVAKVQKKDSVRGGSARPEFVANHRHLHGHHWQLCCFPSLFSYCLKNSDSIPNMKGTFIDVDPSTSSSNTNVSSLSSSGFEASNPKVLHAQRSRSTLITYGTKKETHYALKSIILDRCSTPEFKEELKNEVEILKGLDHPNIVRALETFDFHGRLYIVMELCGGRDLYSRDPYTEDEARRIMMQLCQAIAYLHSKGIVHRDLKYENIMFTDDTPSAEVKLIDFGLSQKFASGEHLHDTVGTVYTMAPELIQGDYDSKADMWSLGVIAFMLLSSSMPFYGESRSAVVDQILHGKYKFQSKRWQQVSEDAKDFVKSLLRRRPEKRPVASAVLHDSPWLSQEIRSSSAVTDQELMDNIQASIQAFAGYKTLKKLALLVVAYKSTSEEIGFLRKMFSKFDTTNNGEITYEEFRAALLENYDYTEEETQSMFDGIDIDGTGNVHYMEFLAATIEAHGSIDEERLAESFDRLDGDDSGVISVQNLKDFLGDGLADAYLEGIIAEAHDNTAPVITYEEFLGLWDTNADEEIKTAKVVVSSRRVQHMKSMLSTVSSCISEDDDEDIFIHDPSHELIQEEKSSKKTGCCYFQDHREMSVRKVVTAKYGDV